MRRIILLGSLFALAACSAPEERTRCSTTSDCRAGEYCAHTSEGSVCWPDDVPPVVAGVTLTCLNPTASGACPRDGRVRVTAAVTDDREVGPVTAKLSLAPDQPVELTRQGEGYAAVVSLAELPFPAFDAEVTAAVTAEDAAKNVVTGEAAAPVPVTRLRWTYDAERPLTAAAVDREGNIYVGRADSSNQALSLNADGTERWRVTLGSSDVVAAPMTWIGTWFASTDGTLYRVGLVDGRVDVTGQCATGAPMAAAPTLFVTSTEYAIAGNDGSSVYVDNDANVCDQTAAGGAVKSPAVVTGAHVYVVAGSILRSFGVLSGGALDPWWTTPPAVGATLAAPAADASGSIWTVSTVGVVRRTSSDGLSEQIANVGGEVNGVVILADDTAVFGDDSGKLKRFGAGAPWTETQMLSGTPSAPIALGGDEPVLLTGTGIGWLYAVRQADGAIVWSQKLGNSALRIANAFFQAGDALPTAYLPSADGKLYAVVVDGDLDPSAPWPKPYHDPQNTGNADIPRP